MRNHLKEILFALSDGQVKFIVGGGVAAVLHGVERVTMDLDISIDMCPDNLARFADVMEHLGMNPRVPVPVRALQDPEVIRIIVEEKHAIVFSLIDPNDPIRYIDVFMTPSLSYPSLIVDTVSFKIDGRVIDVISREKLLVLKKKIQPPREKDLMDIRELERLMETENE
jgi:hypothetical protein